MLRRPQENIWSFEISPKEFVNEIVHVSLEIRNVDQQIKLGKDRKLLRRCYGGLISTRYHTFEYLGSHMTSSSQDPVSQAESRIRCVDHAAQTSPRPRDPGRDGPHRQPHSPGDLLAVEALEPTQQERLPLF